MDSRTFDALVGQFYDAATGRAPWSIPLDNLASQLDLFMCHMIGVDKRSGTLLFSHEGGPTPPGIALDYLRTYHGVNPRIAPAATLGEQEWLHCHQVFDDKFVEADRFYQEYLIPYGGRYLSGTKLVDNDDLLVLFAVLRGVGKQPLSRDEAALMHRIKQHLMQAFRIYEHLRETYAGLEVGREVLDEFTHPMLLVDEHRNIRMRNSAASSALATTDYIVERGAMLGFRDPEADKALTVAIHNLRLSRECDDVLPRRARLCAENVSSGAPVGVFLSAMRPGIAMKAFGHQPLALLIFHDSTSQIHVDPLVVAELFHLTPAEARVSVRLSAGASVDQIADESHVSPLTVRSQIKAVLQKMEAHRQSDIVSRIAALPRLPGLLSH